MRKVPKCSGCGEEIKGIHKKNNPHNPFIGDTFIGWDYEGHRCKNEKENIFTNSLSDSVQFGRWLLKNCTPVYKGPFLIWSYEEGKHKDTLELYLIFKEEKL